MQTPNDNGPNEYNVFFFWTERNNAPAVLREVEGYPKKFSSKEEAIEWINKSVDKNCNIVYCITKSNNWQLEKLKKL